MRIGTILHLELGAETLFDRAASFGMQSAQVQCWNPEHDTEENAKLIKKYSELSGIAVAAFWAGYTERVYWNFTQGPVTLGLIPASLRKKRIEDLKRGADFAAVCGAPAIITHCGFIPENMTDYTYGPVCDAIYEIASYCKSLGIGFWFETGQETPVVLLRTIQRVGLDNLGINLDSANLIMYGKGNPNDAIEVFGKYVRNLHIKDGCPPTDGNNLGHEVQVGKGFVHYEKLLPRLKELGFDSDLIIERELQDGEEKNKDIRETVENLKKWWNN